jgi:hypothetical protein
MKQPQNLAFERPVSQRVTRQVHQIDRTIKILAASLPLPLAIRSFQCHDNKIPI